MTRFGFRNPALLMPEHLERSEVTPSNYCTSAKGQFDDTTAQQMHEAMAAYAQVCDGKTLALFFHGGLVDKQSGMNTAAQLFTYYSQATDPDDKAGNAYPYFFVWESGLWETLSHNLPGIVQETIFQRISDIVGSKAQSLVAGAPVQGAASANLRAPFLDVAVSEKVAASEPSRADIEEVQRAVESDPLINAAKRNIAASVVKPANVALLEASGKTPRTVRTSPATLLSPEIVSAIAAEEAHKESIAPQSETMLWNPLQLGSLALGAGEVLVRIVKRYATGRNHNFHNTVVEEIFRQFYVANIGWAIWNEMKVETGQAFQGDAQHNVGTAMIGELIALYESGPTGLNARITLLGHSTGAVYICNFLQAMRSALVGKPYADKVKFDVIFMAPAVRADILSDTIAICGDLVANFREFTMHDDLESAEILVQFDGASPTVNALLAQIYTSSLLYFISGSLEDKDDDTPLDGMHRFFQGTGAFGAGKFPQIDAVQKFRARFVNPVVLSDTSQQNPQPPLGRRCTSHHHGGFPGDDVQPAPGAPYVGGTLQSVCHLLKTADYS